MKHLKKNVKKNLMIASSILFLTSLSVVFNNMSPVSEEKLNAKGLKEITPEENSKLTKIKIKKVNPSKLGLERINKHRKNKGLPELKPSKNPEIETEDSGSVTTDSSSGGTVAMSSVPAQVDNSTLPYFPKIGNQGSQGSCVAWAITYYQMSHEVCLVKGCDNKSLNQAVYSPRWTYNMINSGVDNGSYFSDAFSLQTNHGASLLADLPYTASDFKGWDLNSENWKKAIYSRMSNQQSILINTDTAFTNVKQLLLNGHVLVIGTYITSWQFRTVMANPNASQNPFVGQAIATHINGTSGGHAMTVVGYDDNIWVDINNNGLVEDSELGAFKIANSWGSSWRNAGYSWASYDAFRATTQVPNFAPAGRRQLTQNGYSFLTTYSSYTPKLLAKVTVSHLARSTMRLSFGSSSLTSNTPQSYFYPTALANKGGAFAFDGSLTERVGTFYFDLTAIASTNISDRIYYLMAADNTSGNQLSVAAFDIVEPDSISSFNYSSDAPATVDIATKNFLIGTPQVDSTAPTAPNNLTGVLKVTTRGKKTTATVELKWGASTDNVGVSGYKIYRNGVLLVQTSSLSYNDTKTQTKQTYNYEVTAIDAQGNESARSNAVSIVR